MSKYDDLQVNFKVGYRVSILPQRLSVHVQNPLKEKDIISTPKPVEICFEGGILLFS